MDNADPKKVYTFQKTTFMDIGKPFPKVKRQYLVQICILFTFFLFLALGRISMDITAFKIPRLQRSSFQKTMGGNALTAPMLNTPLKMTLFCKNLHEQNKLGKRRRD